MVSNRAANTDVLLSLNFLLTLALNDPSHLRPSSTTPLLSVFSPVNSLSRLLLTIFV